MRETFKKIMKRNCEKSERNYRLCKDMLLIELSAHSKGSLWSMEKVSYHCVGLCSLTHQIGTYQGVPYLSIQACM